MKIYLFTNTSNLSKAVLAILLIAVCQTAMNAQTESCGEKDYECKIAAANKVIRADPKAADGYRSRGNAYYNSGQYDLAAADYTKVLEIEPQNGELYSYCGDAFYFLKSYDRAIENYNTALRFDFQSAEMLVRLGNSYDISNKFDAAMKAYNQAIKLDPNSASAYYNRGIALLNKDKNKPAIEDFQRALKISPDFDAARKYLEVAQTAKQEKDARTKEKWANFGKAIDQITEQAAQNSAQSTGQRANSGRSNGSMNADHPVGGSPGEADIKEWIKAYEDEINPTGGVSSPISISLSFAQISYEAPRAANEGDRLRKVKSDRLYPVIVDYTVNQKFSDGTYPKQKRWKFEFYINAEGSWIAFNYGPA